MLAPEGVGERKKTKINNKVKRHLQIKKKVCVGGEQKQTKKQYQLTLSFIIMILILFFALKSILLSLIDPGIELTHHQESYNSLIAPTTAIAAAGVSKTR